MTRPSILTILLVAVSFASQSAQAFQEPVATDGIWHPVTAVLGGNEFPKEFRDSIVLKLAGDTYSVTVNGTPDKGTYVVDHTTEPHRFTITSTVGPNQGKTLLAIFEMTSSESMRVCYDLTGKEFPKEFKSEAGMTHYLVEYRKELPKGAELTGTVVDVPDSDIVELVTADKKKYRVRLNAIDAPEKNQPFGPQAIELVTQLVGNKSVRVVTHSEDRSGQIIGDVYFRAERSAVSDPETQLNFVMVANGFAWHFVRFAPDNKELASSEKQARDLKLGLWNEPNPIAPWDWRKQEADKQK